MSAQHTPGSWRDVAKVDKLGRAYRGQGSARYLTLICGHRVRLTGDRALVPPSRMRCTACRDAIAKAEDRDQ